ncbi:metallophosphoesterase [Aureivirga sp. CE67]|uniref:metallophosphoesterase n=1 Tax=Aureivirga sp. CE67 TaxID=1788983 RepID=UPI0018CB64FF|nr:metallophosphoesterase [Aureivirga sp. CE67]
MNKIFFTSDNHFGHKNILKFSNRPFDSVQEMDEYMIQKWNEKVGENDEVYHLGDVGFYSSGKMRKILERLNGKIYLIKGNHEKSAEACHTRFEWIKDYHELVVKDDEFERGEQLVILFHYAMKEWNCSHWGSYHLYGHSHGTLQEDETSLSFDIGVDCHGFAPLSYEEVKQIMKQKNWKPPFENTNR